MTRLMPEADTMTAPSEQWSWEGRVVVLVGPSARFSNSDNVINALGKLLRLPGLIPPFTDLDTRGRTALHGINFTSCGFGILVPILRWTPALDDGEVNQLLRKIFLRRSIQKLLEMAFFWVTQSGGAHSSGSCILG
jgi:hypothetical protein